MKTFLVLLFVAVAFTAQGSTKVKPLRYYLTPKKDTTRITGGEEVVPHSVPYQVALFLRISIGTAFCGGSLISNEWVLTAAHCGEVTDTYEVVLGAHNITDASETTQYRVNSTEGHVHPEWSRLLLVNDIALIRLPSPVEFSENVQAIRLPSRDEAAHQDFSGFAGIATGWGKDSDESDSVSPVLRTVTVPIVSNTQCVELFGILGPFLPIYDTIICIDGTGGKSTCNGDSGGPLVVVENDGIRTEVGLTSFGISFGCEVGFPAGFTRVSSYIDWINNVTGIPIRE